MPKAICCFVLVRCCSVLPISFIVFSWPLLWRYNEPDGVSNHQPNDCLLNRLFGHRSKKTSKLCVTGLSAGTSPQTVNSPHKWPVTRKMFPFDDVIMTQGVITWLQYSIFAKPVDALASTSAVAGAVTVLTKQWNRYSSISYSVVR